MDYNRDIRKSHPVFALSLGLLSTPNPSFSGGSNPQSKKILLNLRMKCWNSVRNAASQHLNAQGSRVIIVAVKVGAVKIYVTTVEALREKRKTRWNSGNHQNFLSFNPPWMPMYFFCMFFFNLTVYDQTQGTGAVFSWHYGYLSNKSWTLNLLTGFPNSKSSLSLGDEILLLPHHRSCVPFADLGVE